MDELIVKREQQLASLNTTVINAVNFLEPIDENLLDGNQTAHEVLAHLVFWHREYAHVISALVDCRQLTLRSGTFNALNAQGYEKFQPFTMRQLANKLVSLQETLDRLLRQLPDWDIDFPLKQGGQFERVADRLPAIEAHVRNHVLKLKRAAEKTRVNHESKKAS